MWQNQRQRMRPGLALRIQRDGLPALEGVAGHQSEAEQKSIPDDAFDVLLDNNGDFQHLYEQIDRKIVTMVNDRSNL